MHRLQSRRARVLPLPTKCLLYHEKRAMDKLKAWRDAQWWRGVRADDGWARGYGGVSAITGAADMPERLSSASCGEPPVTNREIVMPEIYVHAVKGIRREQLVVLSARHAMYRFPLDCPPST
jgi:hypothetical protein